MLRASIERSGIASPMDSSCMGVPMDILDSSRGWWSPVVLRLMLRGGCGFFSAARFYSLLIRSSTFFSLVSMMVIVLRHLPMPPSSFSCFSLNKDSDCGD